MDVQDDALFTVLLKLAELTARTKWKDPEQGYAYKKALRHAYLVVRDQRRALKGMGNGRTISNRHYCKPYPKD